VSTASNHFLKSLHYHDFFIQQNATAQLRRASPGPQSAQPSANPDKGASQTRNPAMPHMDGRTEKEKW